MIGTNAATWLLLLLGLSSSIDARNRHSGRTNADPDAFLTKYGYLQKLPRGVSHEPRQRNRAVRDFQRMVGIPVTGIFDKLTLWKMAQPRCGMPDKAPIGSGVPAEALTDTAHNPMNYYVPGFKWPKNDLTYRVVNYSPDLYWGTQWRNFDEAFSKWSKVTPLNFREVTTSDQNIEIKFAAGDHGDGSRNAFDGPGGVLAHAYYPEVGDTHFDEDETWTDGTSEGTNLLNVATHELGHALGLGHSNVPNAVMAPYYQGYDSNFKLKEDDIRAIQSLYGSRSEHTTTTPPPTTTTTPDIDTPRPDRTTPRPDRTTPRPDRTTPRPDRTTPGTDVTTKRPKMANPCKMKVDAVFQAPDQRVYMFRGQWVWRLDDTGVTDGYPKQAQKLFEKPPRGMGAAVYSTRTRYTYFFKKNKVFKYYGLRRMIRKKISSKGYPSHPQAALHGRDGRIYLFQGAYYWVFDEATLDIIDPAPRPISTMWPGVPPNIEAAVRYRDGNIYFFKGRKYRKFSERLRRVVDDYPKKTGPAWFGAQCGGTPRAPRLQRQ